MFDIVHTSFNLSIVMRCFFNHHVHSGLVESSGSSEWELLSIVDNKQRGSQERMIEKLHYLVEHKQQLISKAESELKSIL